VFGDFITSSSCWVEGKANREIEREMAISIQSVMMDEGMRYGDHGTLKLLLWTLRSVNERKVIQGESISG
jgi:hypothetical protein